MDRHDNHLVEFFESLLTCFVPGGRDEPVLVTSHPLLSPLLRSVTQLSNKTKQSQLSLFIRFEIGKALETKLSSFTFSLHNWRWVLKLLSNGLCICITHKSAGGPSHKISTEQILCWLGVNWQSCSVMFFLSSHWSARWWACSYWCTKFCTAKSCNQLVCLDWIYVSL